MKKIVLALCLISSLAIKLEAQNSNPGNSGRGNNSQRAQLSPEERAKKDADRAEQKLGLTADQKSKWETAALEKARANEPLKLKMNGSTTPDERKMAQGQVKSNNDKFDSAVSAFLNPDQKTKYEQMKSERANKMKGHHGKQQNGSQQTSPE